MKRMSVPTHVFSIAGEVLAFEATGEAGRTDEVDVSLKQLLSRFGKFERVLVYEYNREGKVLSQHESKMSSDAGITFKATAGNRYLLYPDLGPRFNNSYAVACNLEKAHIAGTLVPRLCTQIFCTDNVFQASQLKERVPELKSQSGLADLGNGVIGGFGGHGNICDQCLRSSSEPEGNFLPARGCSDHVLVDYDPPTTCPEVIVYAHENSSDANWHNQIYKINCDGNNPINLSHNENFELAPDVNHKTKKIVFESIEDNGFTTMDLNGSNRAVIPNTVLGGDPKWSRNDESFIVFTTLPGNIGNSLHRIRPDGSDNVEIVKGVKDNVIRTADVVDDNHVVFSRDSGGFDGEIFIKDMRDSSDPVNLTNTADKDESAPVISHNGSLIAFIVRHPTNSQADEIYIARLDLPSTITVLHMIHLSSPAGQGIRELDFSSDDTRLYVSAGVIETEGTSNTEQLFSIKLDGSEQFRVTLNDESDIQPSTVAR
jgi:hypothetical protein